MPTYTPAKINTAFVTYVQLVAQSDTKKFQVNPTIASGDFKVRTDGGALANLATLPTVDPSGGTWVKISLSAAEMNGANIGVQCVDAAGAEWCDLGFNIQTSARQIDDLSFPQTSGHGTLVAADGSVSPNWADVKSPTTSLNLSGTTVKTATDIATQITAGVTLAGSAIQAIWDAATSALTTAGSIGKWILDKLDVVVSTRLATSGYTVPPTAVAIRTEMDANSTKLAAAALEASLQALITTVGVAGAGLTAADDAVITQIGSLNNLSSAQIQTAAAAALTAFGVSTGANITSAQTAITNAIAALNNLAAGAAMTLTAGERTALADALRSRTLTEGYAADTVAPTLEQILFMILAHLANFSFAGTVHTLKKLDKTTTAMTFNIDDVEDPTSHSRAT